MPSTSSESAGASVLGSASHDAAEHADCAVIIVSYNSARHITRLLDSLQAASSGLRIRCMVVDNNSQDETLSIVRSRNDVMLVETGHNLGYAGAINHGRKLAGSCSSLLILNPDLVLEPGAITNLYRALDEPGVGVAVPMLLTDEGSLYLSLRREPSLMRALGEALFGGHFPARPPWLSETIRERACYQHQRDVAWAGGAALLVSAACNEAVGDWDAGRFFLYSEETDFAARARRCGYRIHYVPTARAHHEDGGSGRSPALGALLAVNRVRYYEKYHRRPATSLFRAIVVFHYLLRAADPSQRVTLGALARRNRWSDLPGGHKHDESGGPS
jgi:GT2 family glycosyltransferase